MESREAAAPRPDGRSDAPVDLALRRSEERLSLDTQGTTDFIYEWSFESGDIDWFGDVDQALGYPEGEFDRSIAGWEAILHPDDVERVMAALQASIASGTLFDIEYRVIGGDRGVRHWHDRGRCLRDEAGAPLRFVGVCTDVTQTRRASAALAESENRYRHLFEGNPHAILIYDPHTYRILGANRAAVRLYGWTLDELLQKDMFQIRPADEAERFVDSVRASPSSMANLGVWRHLTSSGAILDVEVSSAEVMLAGRPVRLSVVTDITERTRLEERLRQSQKMEAIGRLAGGIAHDFNNLLGVMIGYADLFLERGGATLEEETAIAEIRRAAGRAASLTKQLLALSRQQILNPTVVDLNDVVREACALLERLLGDSIVLALDPVPAVAAVRADPGQLGQVVMNLAMYGKDAMPRGGRLTITTRFADGVDVPAGVGEVGARAIVLSVADQGDGLDPALVSRVFEPFFTTHEPGAGAGLGLATVQGIVHQSGGQIVVDSRPGQGTTFHVFLPEVDDTPVAEPAPDEAAPPARAGSETILLVEDEGAVARLVWAVLTRNGYTVIEASSAEEALEVARAHHGRIDLLLTDVVMPGGSGRELAEQFRDLRPGVPVLYMSGYTADALALDDLSRPNAAFLAKPFTVAQVTMKVRELLDARMS